MRKTDRDSIIIPEGFKLEDELATAFHMMEFTNETMFLTGRAGTGKSTLLNYFRKNTIKNCVVLAPTGLAALQVGGSTIHSFFGFPLRTMMKHDPDIKVWSKGHPKMRIIRKMDTLIIDEVSMVRVDLMDAIDQSLRLNMDNDVPFGGKQLIFIGDVFQLSPVVSQYDYQAPDFADYSSQYFFSADSFLEVKPKVLELKKIYRQHDDDFIFLLNRIRQGIAGEDEFEEVNKRLLPTPKADDDFTIVLTSINATADRVNLQKLVELRSPNHMFKGSTEGDFHSKLYPVSPSLSLREGAQVMMVKNDLEGRWVNGSIGKVEALAEGKISVRFADGKVYKIEPVTWEHKIYTWERETNTITFEVRGTYTQYPLRLAWAITIHKSQGLTFDKVVIDMGKGAFAHGQLYVALSRCRSLEGITLRTKITTEDMIVDEAVEYFAGRFGLG